MATQAYSPYAPQVIGDTWVPVAEKPLQLSYTEERGYWMALSSAATVVTARIYPDGIGSTTPFLYDAPGINIYPDGSEGTNTIKQVTIPCSKVIGNPTSPSLIWNPSGSAPEAGVYSPNNDGFVASPLASSGFYNTYFFFATDAFSTQLSGKRILNVEVLCNIQQQTTDTTNIPKIALGYGLETNNNVLTNYPYPNNSLSYNTSGVASVSFGDYTPLYRSTTSPSSDMFPWTYTALQRFEYGTTSSSRLYVRVRTTTAYSLIYYMALRITYCDEYRVAVGAKAMGSITSTDQMWGPENTNVSIQLRDLDLISAPTLGAGNYIVAVGDTMSPYNISFSGLYGSDGVTGKIASLTVPYNLPEPGIRGIIIDKNLTPGQARVATATTEQIPAITLHTSSATVADSHGYNQQIAAPVSLNIVARQGILNAAAANGTSYNMARFYARRYGATSGPLGLRVQGTTTPYALLSVEDFDALEEIANGWKQVDVTFDTPLTFNASGSSSLEWYSNTRGNGQWEVLGARATSVTGFSFSEIGPNQWGAPTTYGGTTQYATYNNAADLRGDFTLMFANMPQVTGLEVDQNSLALDTVDECDQVPGGIVSALTYNTLTWNGASAGTVGDLFDRTVSNGLGVATSGQTYTVDTGASSVWSVSSGEGHVTPAATTTHYIASVGSYSALNVDTAWKVKSDALTTGTNSLSILARYTDANNWYGFKVVFNTDGTVDVGLDQRVAGVLNSIASASSAAFYTPGDWLNVRTKISGSFLALKVWRDGEDEPQFWNTTVNSTSITTAGSVAWRSYLTTGTGSELDFDNFTASYGFGAYELQREDDYTDWQTIALITNPAVVTFNDFEARVGVESRYRVRVCHELDFCGAWSSEVATTIAVPGATGTDLSDTILIFTTNTNQDGSSALAYSEAFDGVPAEAFALFEASDQTAQPMYNRDYRIMFHGTERGGEQFTRPILLNNAAVSIIAFDTAGDALRNLAWDSTPYMCVRDGHGSRWFANVAIPQIVFQPPSNALQIASVTVTEVTGTAYPVDAQL